ncbi:hypothetical protein FE633_02365 [Streptomyces montanus]|uniref:Tetratricopeptide repeat protein n=1 Tax=Streptomyces montanus TaxID=2580423 RepID=A0A5R9FWH7_9ACTN|nr:hypothetical protein [Streptomyces montanus]TLS47831.1 hypothetical protein FE633_02365 [Streptomyces montanus]
MIKTISDAVAYAERMLSDEDEHVLPREEADAFSRRLRLLDPASEPPGQLAESITRLSRLLSRLDMRENARAVIQRALRHMELVEADQTIFPPSAWNQIAVQLALHGELDEARLVLNYALSRARDPSSSPQDASQDVIILTNLSVISLRSDNTEYAQSWAERARAALRAHPDHPQAGRLDVTLASVVVDIAKEWGDPDRLEDAARELGASALRLLAEGGEGQPEVLSALATLADAKLTLARTAGSMNDIHTALGVLERVAQKTMVLFGAESPLALSTQANLARARFELARFSRSKDANAHIKSAVESLDSVVQSTFTALGEHHPQSIAAADNLATARDDAKAVVGLRENIAHFYRPRDNERRNFAKSEAIRREKDLIRIIAFGGASYFMGPLDRYKPDIEERLTRGTKVKVIISNPWNSIASYFLVGETEEPGEATTVNSPDVAMRHIQDGDYMQTFRPVITSYRRLRETYGELIELRIAPMDIPGTSLLTSEVGFFEPYMTADPRHRTRRGLKTFEIEFGQISHFYGVDDRAFDEYWTISYTVDEYEAAEEDFKWLLRRRLEILWATMSGRST